MESDTRRILEIHYLMRLTRALDQRFESLLLTGQVAKWYSGIGNEATTVASASALAPGDVIVTLHRDLGAILTHYCDLSRLCPEVFPPDADRPDPRQHPTDYLHRLACQLLGRAGGFSEGIERSFHYGHVDEPAGIAHMGMISHLGAMIPVAAGAALARKLDGDGGVALNYIGDGGTSTGDFHEGLNMAAVLELPLVLIIENNQYAFSTPAHEQFRCIDLVDRAIGYGVEGCLVDGNDPDAVFAATKQAVERARGGGGPTLIEAVLGRLTGHAVGDGSFDVLPEAERDRYLAADPLPATRQRLLEAGTLSEAQDLIFEASIRTHVEEAVAAGLAAPRPDPAHAMRAVFAGGSAE